MHAARSGHREALKALLASNVQLIGDGGGKIPSVFKVLRGVHRVANLYWVTSRRIGERLSYQLAQINGEPGLLRYIRASSNRHRYS